jgi:transposase
MRYQCYERDYKCCFFSRKTKNKMRKKQLYVGIDVSKEHLDFSVLTAEDLKKHYVGRTPNTHAGIEKMLTKIKKTYENLPLLICMEATGYYSEFVADYLHQNHYQVWVENALR